MTPDEIADVLDRMAAYVGEHGLARGDFYDGKRACTFGAAYVSITGERRCILPGNPLLPKVNAVEVALSSFLGLPVEVLMQGNPLVAWSDATPEAEVIAAYRACAADQRAKAHPHLPPAPHDPALSLGRARRGDPRADAAAGLSVESTR